LLLGDLEGELKLGACVNLDEEEFDVVVDLLLDVGACVNLDELGVILLGVVPFL
jgi:hypothetical protein